MLPWGEPLAALPAIPPTAGLREESRFLLQALAEGRHFRGCLPAFETCVSEDLFSARKEECCFVLPFFTDLKLLPLLSVIQR